MSFQCPHCQHEVVPGQRFCAACGTSLLIEATPGQADPTCAVHPQMRGLGTCARCGAFACARCLRQGPSGETLCERCLKHVQDAPLPWDRREELGTLRAWWKTCVEVMLRPGPTFSVARTTGSMGSSLLFTLLCAFSATVTTGLLYVVIFGVFLNVIPTPQGSKNDPRAMLAFVVPAMLGFWLVVAPLMGVALTVLSAAVDHAVLRLAGATRSFQVTLRANALSQAPALLGLIPFCGMQAAPLWTLVARAFAYRGMHQLKWGPAVAGTLVAPVLFVLLCGGGYLVMFMAMMSQMPHVTH